MEVLQDMEMNELQGKSLLDLHYENWLEKSRNRKYTIKPRKIELQISDRACEWLEAEAGYAGITISEFIEVLPDIIKNTKMDVGLFDDRLLYHAYTSFGVPDFLHLLEDIEDIKEEIKNLEEDPDSFPEEIESCKETQENMKKNYGEIINDWKKKNPNGDLEKEMQLIWQFQKELDGLKMGMSQNDERAVEIFGKNFKPSMFGKFHDFCEQVETTELIKEYYGMISDRLEERWLFN